MPLEKEENSNPTQTENRTQKKTTRTNISRLDYKKLSVGYFDKI